MKVAFLFSFLLLSHLMYSQTGPAGVGLPATNPLWLKADAGTSATTNGAPLGGWNDQSGNANDATQSIALRQPLFKTSFINGMPAIQFDNVSGANADELVIGDNNNLDNTAGLTIFSISQPNSLDGSSARAIVSKRQDADNNESYMIFYFTSDKVDIDIEGTNNRFGTSATFANNTNYLIGMIYDGTQVAASRVRVYVNETFDSGGPRNEASATIQNNLSNVSIGLLNTGDGRPFGGHIAEVIIYRKALNVAERLIVSNYLSAKYNIAILAASDLYAGDTGGNGDYDFEVGGIGNDASGNNVSASSAVTGGLGISQVSGFANNDYLIYGHSSGINAISNADVGGMTGTSNFRWTRIWYLDATFAAVGRTVDLTFDASDSGLPYALNANTTLPSDYVLLYRTGLTGTWTEKMTATSISGDRITFGGVANATDGYYTIGTRNNAGSPLPITLTEFAGIQNEKGVELSWKTATELNNNLFTVERSPDGKNFTKLLEITGAGNSNKELTYSAVDRTPYVGLSYYRLKQTDFNGAYTYSKIIAVKTLQIESSIKMYPNPATNVLNVKLFGDVSEAAVKMFNSKGQSVNVEYLQQDGLITINTSSLQRGLYLVYVTTGALTRAEKIVIQ